MTKWVLVAVAIGLTAYVLGGRSYLKGRFPDAYAKIEGAERILWQKSETILWSRFLMVAGLLLPVLQSIQAIDLTQLIDILPEKARPWLMLGISGLGLVTELLRRATTKPVEQVAKE